MKRIWFIQQKKLNINYLPLRWGLGQYTNEQIEALIRKFKPNAPDSPKKYCHKIYTTRTHQLSGEYVVVEGDRYHAKPVEPEIRFRADPAITMKLNLLTELVSIDGEWGAGGIHTSECYWKLNRDGLTFPELDLGIRGATFEQLRDELLRLNPKANLDTPFYVNRLEKLEV